MFMRYLGNHFLKIHAGFRFNSPLPNFLQKLYQIPCLIFHVIPDYLSSKGDYRRKKKDLFFPFSKGEYPGIRDCS